MTALTGLLALVPFLAPGFSLLGPYASWMDEQKGYRQREDIGGPMNIGEGYRWNVPIITYGFDRSFLDYFGSNGVAAVESAIAIVNALPSASALDPQNYPTYVWRYNFLAQAVALADLKSQALTTLLEEMGLADPVRWTFCLRDMSPTGTNYSFYVIRRNFDVSTGQSSDQVNGTLFLYRIYHTAPSASEVVYDAVEAAADPYQPFYTAVASQNPDVSGRFVTGVTADDAGGLRYLLNQKQIFMEDLLPDVHLASTNSGTLVRRAYRPGIEKISFIRHPAGMLSGEFQFFTNSWTDIYYNFDTLEFQDVERVTAQPDILFSAGDLGVERGWTRTGTTNWANNADLNGNPGGAGPGVIQPPIVISFNKVGPFHINYSPHFLDEPSSMLVAGWASFDATTNAPVLYPNVQIAFQPTQIRLHLLVAGSSHDIAWMLGGQAYGQFLFQTATNLTEWSTLTLLTNSGAPFDYQFSAPLDEPWRFFRAVPAQ